MAVKRRASKRKARRATRRVTKKKAKKRVAPKKRAVRRKRVRKKRVVRKKRITKKSQTGTKLRVWNGTAKYTRGGLMKKDLMMNKRGRIVSRRRRIQGLKAYAKRIKNWTKACGLAREELGLQGFVACRKGTEYYKLTMKYYIKLRK